MKLIRVTKKQDSVWPSLDKEVAATFQMKVIGKKGAGVLQNSSYLISTSDGTDTYEASDQNLTVRVGSTVNWMLILVIVLCLLLLLLLLLLLRRKKKEPKK
jgi:LPXTG-motif cell wall-anchored protein